MSHTVKMLIEMADPESIHSVLHVGLVHEDEEGDSLSKDGDNVHGVPACSVTVSAKTVAEEMTFLTDQVHSSSTPLVSYGEACSPVDDSEGLKYEATPVARKQSTKEVVIDTSENSSSESEAFDGNELGHPTCGSLMSLEFPLCTDCKQLNLCLQNTLCPGKAHLIKQILRKYGDITKGGILQSIEAKTALLQLVAEAVERLHSHTLDTIDAHEMQVIWKWADDAAAVGFHVEWLQQRIKKIVAISKYRDSLMRLNEINEQIVAAKLALLELQLQQIILKKEIDPLKAEMDREDFCRSNLCEGLF